MRVAIFLLIGVGAALLAYVSLDLDGVASWALDQQRGFQNQMAGAIRALRTGEPGAYAALLAAAGAYGFVHALGPGHGKYLIGGVGLGTTVPIPRLLMIAVASSLAQALWAILLVYGGFFLFEVSAKQVTTLAEYYLATASYLAIAGVGLILIWRGTKGLAKAEPKTDAAHGNHHHNHHHHDESTCSCHSHGPSPSEVARLSSVREAVALIFSIAVRPCTGAIFLLVIAWTMNILVAGAVAVVVMGLGTAMLTSLVAVSSGLARTMTIASATTLGSFSRAFPVLEIFTGSLVVLTSLVFLRVLAP